MVAERVAAAKAKAQLSALVAEVAYGGKHFVIERRGKPLAALVSVEELERLEQGLVPPVGPLGALALMGAWKDVGDEKIDRLIKDIYTDRSKDAGRSVRLED